MDRTEFNEALASLMELAIVNGNSLSDNDIKLAFTGILEDEALFGPIYKYLQDKNIKINDGVDANISKPDENESIEKSVSEKDSINSDDDLESHILDMYKKEIKHIKTGADYDNLLLNATNGDNEARNELVTRHLPLVVSLADNYKGKGVRTADLIQEGNLALILAISTYENGTDFIAHITKCIIDSFDNAIAEENNSKNISEHLVERVNALSDATEAIAEKSGRQATLKELCEYLALPEDEVKEAMKISLDALSIEPEE